MSTEKPWFISPDTAEVRVVYSEDDDGSLEEMIEIRSDKQPICYVVAKEHAAVIRSASELFDALHWVIFHLEGRCGLRDNFSLLTRDERNYLKQVLQKAKDEDV